MDINARLNAAIAARKNAGLQIWFVGAEFGKPVAINCANEAQRQGHIVALRAKGRTILNDGRGVAA